jgi:hypothetical protein
MRFLYRLFARITGGFAGRIGQLLFKSLWSRIDHEAPPRPTSLDASLAKVVVGAVLEAATMAGVAAVVERATASTFSYLFGVSPERKEKKQKKESE